MGYMFFSTMFSVLLLVALSCCVGLAAAQSDALYDFNSFAWDGKTKTVTWSGSIDSKHKPWGITLDRTIYVCTLINGFTLAQ